MRLIKVIRRMSIVVILITRTTLKVITRTTLKVIIRTILKVIIRTTLKVIIRIGLKVIQRIGPLVERIGLIIGPLTKVSGLSVSQQPSTRLSLRLFPGEYILHICPGIPKERIRSNTLLRNSL
jgi:hypothetical protein